MKKPILGHIDCPACGAVGGVSITHDKNGEPYGYCEANCDLQMRIGGKARRVAAFVARYPWAAAPSAKPGDDPPDDDPPPKPEPISKPEPPPPKKSHWLEGLGVAS